MRLLRKCSESLSPVSYTHLGMYGNVALLDISSMHPHSAIAEVLFGVKFTRAFRDIVEGRVSIKHEAWDEVNHMLDGKLTPYILSLIHIFVAGVIGVVTSAVMACKATTKVGEILDKTKEDVETIHKCEADESVKERYSSEDAQKDLAIVYVQTGMKFAKLYGPSVILGALSITSIMASNNILRKRNVALSAAYAAIDKGFKEYRSRVIERFGEEVDRELKYNLKAKKFDETVIDEETGKEKKVKKNGFVVSPGDISGYARFFEKYTQDEDGKMCIRDSWQSATLPWR